jgi:uncharacterized membrane-anchored protein
MKIPVPALLLLPLLALAAGPDPDAKAARLAEAERLAAGLHYRTGVVELGDHLARVSAGSGYKFLGAADSATLLSGIWRNPPQPDVLGCVMPADFDPLERGSWLVVISYSADGYVRDADAGKIDYADLLQKLKDATAEANKERVARGYPSIEVVGWAEPPRYDPATHKLYWAKEIRFGTSPQNTLNYNFRILGRGGVLVLNAVAPMSRLGDVKQATPAILSMVDFEPGHRYADFTEGTDKVATYGVAALVLGGIAAKAGLLKGVWVALLALKKFIILGFLALLRYAKRARDWIRGRFSREKPHPALEPPAGSP